MVRDFAVVRDFGVAMVLDFLQYARMHSHLGSISRDFGVAI